MLKSEYQGDLGFQGFSHLKNLSMLKYFPQLSSYRDGFSHLKNLSMLKYPATSQITGQGFSHLKNLSMLKLLLLT